MNDALAERIAVALEQLVLELAESKPAMPQIARPVAAPAPAPVFAPLEWVCPIHGQSKTVPAGVSQRTGKPYSAFIACPEMGCNEKPGYRSAPAPARAIAPSDAGLAPRTLP
jgi:hypothetical protein